MKKLLLSSLFLLFACVAFAQNDKLLVGKWNIVDLVPPAEVLKTMGAKEKSQMKVMVKKIAKNSYFNFANDNKLTSVMDVGFGTPSPLETKYELLETNTMVHIFPNSMETESGKQSVEESYMKITKLTKNELVLTGTDAKSKGMKMIFKKAK